MEKIRHENHAGNRTNFVGKYTATLENKSAIFLFFSTTLGRGHDEREGSMMQTVNVNTTCIQVYLSRAPDSRGLKGPRGSRVGRRVFGAGLSYLACLPSLSPTPTFWGDHNSPSNP